MIDKEPNTRCAFCGKPIYIKPSRIKRTKNLTCSKTCINELRKTLYLGENNPNFKHKKDFDIFYNLTYNGAYILGLIYSDGHIKKDSYTVEISQREDYSGNLLKKVSHMIFNKDLTKKCKNRNLHLLNINDKEFVEYLLTLGGISRGEKSHIIKMPKIPKDKIWSFICGFFDGDGSFKYNYKYPEIAIKSNSRHILEEFAKYWNVNYAGGDSICASGFNALDICGRMYKDVSIYHKKKNEYFHDILNWEPTSINMCKYLPLLKYKKNDPMAVAPFKKRVTDSGFDLSIINLDYDNKSGLYIGDTKLSIYPPPGFYCELIGRSSLPLNGFMFVGGVGVIDQSYTGSVKLTLKKINDNAKMPELPFKCAQIVIRKFFNPEIAETNTLQTTERNSNGFGSTN